MLCHFFGPYCTCRIVSAAQAINYPKNSNDVILYWDLYDDFYSMEDTNYCRAFSFQNFRYLFQSR